MKTLWIMLEYEKWLIQIIKVAGGEKYSFFTIKGVEIY
ncbi:hypothetical protein LCGC14_0757950 [marine sediment metagenome]|uniref:Uncharacterized protein n=1 Tax=marine sediment metagenome TaxID=412755 RepID=A0A0F9Q238_9ZZZZ